MINASRQTGSVIGVALLGGLLGGGLAFDTGLRIALTAAGGASSSGRCWPC
ncbi:hypothetical protein [Streptomyces millisiae]|uniref:Major facilitator superfamily (MFS) profile domain-containing protein n=1 Tax=Streptomyces millisiae TaxID=3075542 RepID=A0ABU2LXT4_9ACTN|nr:hypothetical protein [Streptomyces sp. DSM 44918]MDT0322406.1 hypothetical protein [Streptomyces sp. DSM 44918]